MKLTRFTRRAAAAAASTLVVSALAALASATPAFAAPAGSISPTSGNTPAFNTTITASGFHANAGITIAECAGAASTVSDPSPCTGFNSDTSNNATAAGAISGVVYQIVTITTAQSGNGAIQCDTTHACSLYIGEQLSDFTQNHIVLDFTFTTPPHAVAPVAATPQGPITVSQGGNASITVNYGTANDTNGHAETIDASTSTVSTAPTKGTVSVTSPGVFKYTNTSGTGPTTDSFVVSGATASCPAATGGPCTAPVTAVGNNVTINVNIQALASHSQGCDATTGIGSIGTPPAGSCSIDQILTIPVTGADLTMSEATSPLTGSGNPVGAGGLVTLLNHTVVAGNCSGPIVLTGQPLNACGQLSPVTVVNARGTDNPWTLSGQVTDFLDPAIAATPASQCDTPGTYSNHCIPGGNLSWVPVAAVGHDIVPGDVAAVTPGNAVLPPTPLAAVLNRASNAPALNGTKTQANPVVEPSPLGGLHNASQTLCSTASTTSGGSFVCGANLVVAVPASAAAPAAPGYQAILTLTLLG